MPACTYISDHEADSMRRTGDKDIDELLLEVNFIDDGSWRCGVRTVHPRRKWWQLRAPKPYKVYTLYVWLYAIEYQVINLCTEGDTGSVFGSGRYSKQNVCNYLLGYIGGRARREREDI